MWLSVLMVCLFNNGSQHGVTFDTGFSDGATRPIECLLLYEEFLDVLVFLGIFPAQWRPDWQWW
ncbi:MAG: hypothetical protein R2856_12995 [Caldilineaceae bacterium]